MREKSLLFLNRALVVIEKVGGWISWISGIFVIIVMILSVVDITSAKFFSRPIPGTLDIVGELMVFVVVLPLAYVTLKRGHIRIDVLEHHIGKAGRYVLKIIQALIGVAIMGFMTWRTSVYVGYVVKAEMETGTIFLPIWPANVAIVVGCGMFTLVCVLLLCKALLEGANV